MGSKKLIKAIILVGSRDFGRCQLAGRLPTALWPVAGKPVVSTPFPELQQYRDVVYEARTPKEFAEGIRQAIAEDCPERIAVRRERVRDATWDSKAKLVLEELFEGGR